MTIRTTLVCMAIGIMLTACAKDDNPTGPGNPGSGFSNPYYPMTTGSTWTFVVEQRGSFMMEYTSTIDGDTVIDGKTYIRAHSTVSTGNSYARIESNGDVYSVSSPGGVELKVLKGNPGNGDSWALDRNVQGTTNYYTFSVGNADTVCTVRGRAYDNVVRVNMVDSVILLGQKYQVESGRYFFAKGVGLVRSEFDQTGINVDLTAYSIK